MDRLVRDHLKLTKETWVDSNFLDWFRVTLPDVFVKNTLRSIKPVTFEYRTDSYLICIQ